MKKKANRNADPRKIIAEARDLQRRLDRIISDAYVRLALQPDKWAHNRKPLHRRIRAASKGAA